MGFKKVTANEVQQCIHCQGKSGLRYFVKINLPCIVKWGSPEPEPEVKETSEYVTEENQPMTAKCIDCGKRVEFKIGKIVIEPSPCYACGEPRGKGVLGGFVTPCPHCGDEIPL